MFIKKKYHQNHENFEGQYARGRGASLTRAMKVAWCGPRPVPVFNAASTLDLLQHFADQFRPTNDLWVTLSLRENMPPDSKDLSSAKEKSPSFHRLHTTDFERMKGMYLTPEELRGFDKYKVGFHQSIAAKTWMNLLTIWSFLFSTNRKIRRLCQST